MYILWTVSCGLSLWSHRTPGVKDDVLFVPVSRDCREITDIKCLEYTEYADDDAWFRHMACILRGKRLI